MLGRVVAITLVKGYLKEKENNIYPAGYVPFRKKNWVISKIYANELEGTAPTVKQWSFKLSDLLGLESNNATRLTRL